MSSMSAYLMSVYIKYLPISVISKHPVCNIKDFYNFWLRFRCNYHKSTLTEIVERFVLKKKDNFQIDNKETVPLISKLKEYVAKNNSSIQLCNEENMRIISNDKIELLILEALESKDMDRIPQIFEVCLQYNITPSSETTMKILWQYSNCSNIKSIIALQKIYEYMNHDLFKSMWCFQNYLATAYWKKGNIKEAFKLFIDSYETYKNRNLTICIRKMLEMLINEAVQHSSEASIVTIRENVEIIATKYREYYPLLYLWRYSLLSEWFADQQRADELFNSSESLKQLVGKRIYYESKFILKHNQEDAMIRLLQMLLKHQLLYEYTDAIRLLFDYRLRRHDFGGCSEIIHNCSVLKIQLTALHNEKYLLMMISKGKYFASEKPCTKKIDTKDFKFKF